MVPATRFTDPVAVETWDTWFRWREDDALRDVTIDATWWRVADTLAAVEGPQAPLWARRFVDAFSRWRMLPDERLLLAAGTGASIGDFDRPAAVLNVAAFVVAPLTLHARFDRDRFIETAALAVRLLDDALGLYGASHASAGLRIGVIGLADALRLLSLPYASVEALELARTVAAALAKGTLRGAIDLAGERGAQDPDSQGPDSQGPDSDRHRLEAGWRARGISDWLIEEGLRCGVRHAALTAIDPHPRLARLANNVADALDPLFAQVRSEQMRTGHDARPKPASAEASCTAQLQLRAAMAPWIDASIDYPLVGVAPSIASMALPADDSGAARTLTLHRLGDGSAS